MVRATKVNCESNEVFYLFITIHSFTYIVFYLIQGCLFDYFAPYHEYIESKQKSTTQLLCHYPILNLQTYLKYITTTTN